MLFCFQKASLIICTWFQQEEEERSQKWKCFIEQQSEPILTQPSAEESARDVESVTTERQSQPVQELTEEGDTSCVGESGTDIHKETDANKVVPAAIIRTKSREVQRWVSVRQSLSHIESMMSSRVQKKKDMRDVQRTISHNHLPSIEEGRHSGEDFQQACEEVCENAMDCSSHGPKENSRSGDGDCAETLFPSRELEFLVQGGVPRDLRGEVLSSVHVKCYQDMKETSELNFSYLIWWCRYGKPLLELELVG